MAAKQGPNVLFCMPNRTRCIPLARLEWPAAPQPLHLPPGPQRKTSVRKRHVMQAPQYAPSAPQCAPCATVMHFVLRRNVLHAPSGAFVVHSSSTARVLASRCWDIMPCLFLAEAVRRSSHAHVFRSCCVYQV
jgi:hypothetical protein